MKEFIYKIIDLFTGGKGLKVHVSGFDLRLPTRYFKYFGKDYELDNVNFLNDHLSAGMNAIDVGAHIGFMSIIMAKKVGYGGKVFSFEPTPTTFKLLKKTIEINKLNNIVIPIDKAVAEKKGVTFFYVTDVEASNSNSMLDNKREHNDRKIEVQLTTIDDVCSEQDVNKIDLIKIDAEGAEYSVLKGAAEVIDRFRPKIILALHPAHIKNFGDNLSDIWDFITAKNYSVTYKNRPILKDEFINRTDLFDIFLV